MQSTKNTSISTRPSFRPNTLLINESPVNNYVGFTPNDYKKLNLSTPDLDAQLQNSQTTDLTLSPLTEIESNLIQFPLDAKQNKNASATNYVDLTYTTLSAPSQNMDHCPQGSFPTYGLNATNFNESFYNPPMTSSMIDNESSSSTMHSSSPGSYYQHPVQVKEESQQIPSDRTDNVRREKKRERNRQAAQKCRTRKLNRIAELQKRVDELQGKNSNLTNVAESLQIDIERLEKQLQEHHTHGCALHNITSS